MMERYSHIRMEAKRRAVDDLSGTDFAPVVAQNWAQFFLSDKSDEANLLKTSGEPGRTRTSNPLIKSSIWPFCTRWDAIASDWKISDPHFSQRVHAGLSKQVPATLSATPPVAFISMRNNFS